MAAFVADDAPRRGARRRRGAARRDLGVDHVELRHIGESDLGWTTKSDLYVTFCRALAPSSDANLKAIPRKKRADLRKAIDNRQLTVQVGGDFDDVLPHLFREPAQSRHARAAPPLLSRIIEELGPAAELSAVHGPDGPVAALMTFFFRDRAMPYYGGATPAARPLHAYDLLYWSLMERARRARRRLLRFRAQQARHRLVRLQDLLGLRARAAALRVPSRRHGACRTSTRSIRNTGS